MSLIGSVWVRRDRRRNPAAGVRPAAAAVVLAHHAPRPRPPRGAADVVDDSGHQEAAHEGVDEHAARHDDGKLDEEEQRDDRQRPCQLV